MEKKHKPEAQAKDIGVTCAYTSGAANHRSFLFVFSLHLVKVT
jgi:hypothetical protein